MKRKVSTILLFVLVICLFVGCEREYTPDPAVREYLNNGMTAAHAYEQIATASYVETRTLQNKLGEVRGTFRSEVSLDKTDKDNLKLTIHSVYEGECIEEENVTELRSTLAKVDGVYKYTVEKTPVGSNKPMVAVRDMKEEDAQNLIVAIIYSDNGSFDEGLYYGDLFMLRIFRFPPESFYVDTEANLCVFDEGMLIKEYFDLEDVELHQITKINQLGLLTYNYEKYIGTQSDYVLISETVASYEYAQSL